MLTAFTITGEVGTICVARDHYVLSSDEDRQPCLFVNLVRQWGWYRSAGLWFFLCLPRMSAYQH